MSFEKKGLVMDTAPGEITVLTPHGEFCSAPWHNLPYPEIGSEISFIAPSKEKVKGKLFNHKRILALAACIVLVFFTMVLGQGMLPMANQQVVAFVNVDINPSIELGLNKKGLVVTATGLNQDGELLLQGMDLIDLEVEAAVKSITQAAVEQDYLQAGKENNVLITVSDVNKVKDKVENLAEKVTEQLDNQQINVNTQIIEVNKKLHSRAKELGVSPGKYVILMEAVEEGLDVSLEDIKGSSITKAIKEAGGIPGEVISRAQKDKNQYKEMDKKYQKKQKNDQNKDRKKSNDNQDSNNNSSNNGNSNSSNNGNSNNNKNNNEDNDKNKKKDNNKDSISRDEKKDPQGNNKAKKNNNNNNKGNNSNRSYKR